MGNVREFFSPFTKGSTDLKDKEYRENILAQVKSLGLTTPSSAMSEVKTGFNAISLTSGEHGGIVMDKPASTLKGVTAGAVVGKKATFRAEGVVDGVVFSNVILNSKDVDELAYLSSSARVVFIGCRFRKTSTSTPTFVKVASGAIAVFIGCVFEGGPGSGTIFDHAGAASNIILVGCRNMAGAATFGTVQSGTDQMITGSVTIAAGSTSNTVSVGAAYNAKPVFLTASAQPTAAQTKPLSGVVAAGTLTVTCSNAPGGSGLPVYYMIDGR